MLVTLILTKLFFTILYYVAAPFRTSLLELQSSTDRLSTQQLATTLYRHRTPPRTTSSMPAWFCRPIKAASSSWRASRATSATSLKTLPSMTQQKTYNRSILIVQASQGKYWPHRCHYRCHLKWQEMPQSARLSKLRKVRLTCF